MCWSGNVEHKPHDPVIDVEKLLVDYAWEESEPFCWDRLWRNRKFQLEVDWDYLDISHEVLDLKWRPGGTKYANTPDIDGKSAAEQDPEKNEDGKSVAEQNHHEYCENITKKDPYKDGKSMAERDICLFKTKFENNLEEAQNFTFKAERSTTSKYEVKIEKGFKVGASLQIPISLAGSTVGGPTFEYSMNKSTNQTLEEQLTWSVDSQVKVEGKSTVVATLMIHVEEEHMDMTVESIVTARTDHIPVYVRSKKSGRIIQRLEIPSNGLPKILSDFEDIGDSSFKFVTKGVVKLIYGVKQVIKLETQKKDSQAGQPGTSGQPGKSDQLVDGQVDQESPP